MPVDYEPSDNGNILLSSDSDTAGRPLAGVLGPGPAAGARRDGQKLHLHHKLSCPFASAWARKS